MLFPPVTVSFYCSPFSSLFLHTLRSLRSHTIYSNISLVNVLQFSFVLYSILLFLIKKIPLFSTFFLLLALPFVLRSFSSQHAYFSYLSPFFLVFQVIFLSLPISLSFVLSISPLSLIYMPSPIAFPLSSSQTTFSISLISVASPLLSRFISTTFSCLLFAVFFFFRLPPMVRAVEGSFEVTWLAGGCAGSFHVRFPLPFLPKSRSPRGRNRIINYSPY